MYYSVFFRIMSADRIVSFRIAPEKVGALDSLARAMDRDRSYLLNEAIETYLARQRRFVEMVEEGLRASRRGELVDDEEVGAMIESMIESTIESARQPAARARRALGKTARKKLPETKAARART